VGKSRRGREARVTRSSATGAWCNRWFNLCTSRCLNDVSKRGHNGTGDQSINNTCHSSRRTIMQIDGSKRSDENIHLVTAAGTKVKRTSSRERVLVERVLLAVKRAPDSHLIIDERVESLTKCTDVYIALALDCRCSASCFSSLQHRQKIGAFNPRVESSRY